MLAWLWLAGVTAVLDQGTKWAAETWLTPYAPVPLIPSLNLTLMYNEGAAFSFLAGAGGWQRWLFAGLAVAVTAALAVWLHRLRPTQRLTAAGIALLMGGAVGNLIDRILTGRVVDFIDVYYGQWHWPAFNLADSAITLGIALLLLESLREGRPGGD